MEEMVRRPESPVGWGWEGAAGQTSWTRQIFWVEQTQLKRFKQQVDLSAQVSARSWRLAALAGLRALPSWVARVSPPHAGGKGWFTSPLSKPSRKVFPSTNQSPRDLGVRHLAPGTGFSSHAYNIIIDRAGFRVTVALILFCPPVFLFPCPLLNIF